jgi:uncharacterized repeat protein (TIGR03803 family)
VATLVAIAATSVLSSPRMACAQPLEVLHSFSGRPMDGEGPTSLIQTPDGDFYSTTFAGGTSNFGTIFRMTPEGRVTILYSFSDAPNGWGVLPNSLIQGTDGNFYGYTIYGGAADKGSLFRMTPDGTVAILHSFSGPPTDGALPSSLIHATDGSFYGTTSRGGPPSASNPHGYGTAFRMTSTGIVSILHEFTGAPGDGWGPGGLIQATDGNFFGLTGEGGDRHVGTAFKMTPEGTVTTLHMFSDAPDAANPASLIQTPDGNFYGTTVSGGAWSKGTVFKMTPEGTVTILYSFKDDGDGEYPTHLIRATDGNLWGVTISGRPFWGGTVFKMSPTGTVSIPYAFEYVRGGSGFIQAQDGSFYGTAGGGAFDLGAVYRLTFPAEIMTPAPGSRLTGSTVLFEWTTGIATTAYGLSVGTTVGGWELFDKEEGTALSNTVTGLPTDGTTVYVRLWSLTNGAWRFNDYTYLAATGTP